MRDNCHENVHTVIFHDLLTTTNSKETFQSFQVNLEEMLPQ